jgi:hypothetical protein
MRLVIKSDNQLFEVKAICTSMGDANVICNLDPKLGVIAEDQEGRIYVATLEAVNASIHKTSDKWKAKVKAQSKSKA